MITTTNDHHFPQPLKASHQQLVGLRNDGLAERPIAQSMAGRYREILCRWSWFNDGFLLVAEWWLFGSLKMVLWWLNDGSQWSIMANKVQYYWVIVVHNGESWLIRLIMADLIVVDSTIHTFSVTIWFVKNGWLLVVVVYGGRVVRGLIPTIQWSIMTWRMANHD